MARRLTTGARWRERRDAFFLMVPHERCRRVMCETDPASTRAYTGGTTSGGHELTMRSHTGRYEQRINALGATISMRRGQEGEVGAKAARR